MQRFILIDGNAILHRAYHALPPLTDKNGRVVNAVYGFFSMFLKIVEDVKPTHLAVCFDRPKPTFRKALYAGYQAKRPSMDGDLVPQIGVVHEILNTANIQIFEVDGYEADDLIGTLASQIQSSKTNVPSFEVIIVSGDRDMLQLVNHHVKVLAPITGITNMLLFDNAKVEEKYGIKPMQIIDYKALVGDASDNYPGVSGIGPKTAKDLLQKYETFEKLYQHISELPQKIMERLSVDAEQAALAKKLATIVTDAPITLDIKCCKVSNFDMQNLKKSFEKLGFKSLLKRFGEEKVEVKKEDKKVEKKEKNEQLGLL